MFLIEESTRIKMIKDLKLMKDIVAQLPDEIARYKKVNGKLPDDLDYEPGFFCVWNKERFFIHTRATLPIRDIENGVGFGLWVEVSKQDFNKYAEAQKDDEKYKQFQAEGTLANEWPGFENIFGVKVLLKTVRVNEKVYIREVFLDKPRDPLFEVALLTSSQNKKGKQMIKKLVTTYLKNGNQN